MLDDIIAAALGDVLELDDDLAEVWVNPPEDVVDHPAALILGSTGEGTRDAYRGGWAADVTMRVLILVRPRVELAEAIEAARPWAGQILGLLASHDELQAVSGDDPIARLTRATWTVGRVAYAGVDWAAVDFTLVYEMWMQIVVSCDGIGAVYGAED